MLIQTSAKSIFSLLFILFHSSTNPDKDLNRRVVGLPDEVINYYSLSISVNGERLRVAISGLL